MPMNKNSACVEQAAPSKPPVLHPGEITPQILWEFEDACLGCFNSKEIKPEVQVRRVLARLKDPCVGDWVAAERACLHGHPFNTFIAELRSNYLDPDWEDKARCKLGALMQGHSETFWEFSMRLMSMNSLLRDTESYLTPKDVRNRLQVGMDHNLAKRCNNAKLSEEKDFKKWSHAVKSQADVERAKKGNRPTARPAPVAASGSAPSRNHPVATVMGTTDPDTVYASTSVLSVLDGDATTESDDDVSDIVSCPTDCSTGGRVPSFPSKSHTSSGPVLFRAPPLMLYPCY
jgi:hypothetical protein